MHLLKTCYEYPPLGGGGARVVRGLARELARRGHRVDLVTMAWRDLPESETDRAVRVRRVGCLRLREAWCTTPEMASYDLSAWRTLAREGTPDRWDLNHTHFIFPDGLLAWGLRRRLGLPFVVTAHGSDVPGYNPDRFRLEHRLLAPIWRRVVRSAERVICPSDTIRALVERKAPGARTVRIPNGFDPSRLSAQERREPRVLTVSRLVERKGIQHLIEACQGLESSWSLHVVGEGPFRARVERQAASVAAGVRFHGWLDNDSAELAALYETSSIFVLPSSAENFPVVLLEAMAAGLATITIEGTGSAEVVGDTGLLVPAGDPAALRAAIERLIASAELRSMLGRAARERLVRHYAWAAVARLHERLYAEVLAERGRLPHPVAVLGRKAG
jgi:glycosyltransferase involved in cell wall biosynthesis